MAWVIPFLFEAIQKVPMPSTNTSEVDRQYLQVFSAFNKLIQNCTDSVELRNLEAQGPILNEKLAKWLVMAFETHPDKGFKKTVATIFKSVILQVTNLKYVRAQGIHINSIAMIHGFSVSALNKLCESQPGAPVAIESLSQDHKAFVEAGLMVSVKYIYLLNPKLLDDLQIAKSLVDIQIAFSMLGYGPVLKGQLAALFSGP